MFTIRRVAVFSCAILATVTGSAVRGVAQTATSNSIAARQGIDSKTQDVQRDSPNLITFSEFPVGTTISDQYRKNGIVFTSPVFITTDTAQPRSPVLSGTPKFDGPINAHFFSENRQSKWAVTKVTFLAGYFDSVNSASINSYDPQGKIIEELSNSGTGVHSFDLRSRAGIYDQSRDPLGIVVSRDDVASIKINLKAKDDFGFSADNIAFQAVECDNDKEKMIKQYVDRASFLEPRCDYFTRSASNKYYSYGELTIKDEVKGGYPVALLRQPMMSGLATWIELIGVKRKINSAFRSPNQQAKINPKVKNGRHIYGDAVDIANITRTRKEHEDLRKKARMAGADWVEDIKDACGLSCVHADWRETPGAYVTDGD